MKKAIIIIGIIILIILVNWATLWAGEIKYNREKAKNYATLHCSPATYNHKDYKCWNVDLEECRKDNPQNTGRVDCANFVSQALIAGGLDFNDSYGAVTIGKGEKAGTKGHPLVKNLLPALLMGNCFEIITDPLKAQPGDILSSTKNSHVVIYGGNNTYYGHTEDRCGATYRPPESIWDHNVIYRFKDDDKCKKCVKGFFTARLEDKCDECSTCDPATGECKSACDKIGPGRCVSFKKCGSISGFRLCMNFGPGGDCPDDTLTSGASTPLSNEAIYPSKTAPVGILDNGYPYDMLRVLSKFEKRIGT